MHDCQTVVTAVTRTPAQPGLQRRFVAVGLRPATSLTRAHLLVARHRGFAQRCAEAATAVAVELTRSLGAETTCEARLAPEVISPGTSLSDRSVFALLELTALPAQALVELDAPLVALLLERAAGSTQPVSCFTRLTRIEEASLGWLMLSALTATRAASELNERFGARLVSLVQTRREALLHLEAGRSFVAVDVKVCLGARGGMARVFLAATALQSALERLAPEAPAPLSAELLEAAQPITCLVGPTLLERPAADALSEGDVVLFRGVAPTPEGLLGPGRIRSSSFQLTGEWVAGGFTVHQAAPRVPSREFTMSEETQNVPVEVAIELARLRLTIAELATIRTGGVLALHVNAATPVTLRIGDRAVARAELVDIEGEIGARIIAML